MQAERTQAYTLVIHERGKFERRQVDHLELVALFWIFKVHKSFAASVPPMLILKA